MDKLEPFPKEDHEKKQLEEIAHLYFSEPATPSKARTKPQRSQRPFEAFRPSPRFLFIHCIAGQPEHDLSTRFLFNLAVMLKILNGPVLLIGSERFCEKRFLFGFRPDRERLAPGKRPTSVSSSFGPMGLCLVDGRLLGGDLAGGQAEYGVDLTGGGIVPFRYILSDEVRSGAVFGSASGLALLLVTPVTTACDLPDLEEEAEDKLFAKTRHVGIVVAGARCPEEADALYLYWRDRLADRCEGEILVENFGASSLDSHHAGVGPGSVEVLENPESAQARFYQATASLIRSKRSEIVSGVGR